MAENYNKYIAILQELDTLQKVKGLKSAIHACNAWEHFGDHAHIGDKGRRLWMINYFLACCIKNNNQLLL